MKIFCLMMVFVLLVSFKVSAEDEAFVGREAFVEKHVLEIKKDLPLRIDEGTVFTDVRRDIDVVVYTYQLDLDTSEYDIKRKIMLATEMRKEMCGAMKSNVCIYLKDVLDHGFTVNSIYQDKKGLEIFQCTFLPEMCGNLPAVENLQINPTN